MWLNKKGQSTMEYAILIAVVVAALLSIQIYIKRGVQGRLRSATDEIGEQFDAKKTNYTYTTTRTGKTVEITSAGVTSSYAGGTADGTTLGEADTTIRKGNETVGSW